MNSVSHYVDEVSKVLIQMLSVCIGNSSLRSHIIDKMMQVRRATVIYNEVILNSRNEYTCK
jgi:hypothetical protein